MKHLLFFIILLQTFTGLKAGTPQDSLYSYKILLTGTSFAVFNLDATAGRRGGYHMFNEYGNIFLENRYTDWQNYYPYWTLRNLWKLSRYVPAEKLQIEYMNKWRNAAKYAGAATMAGQPLAWFEGRGLPQEALSINKPITAYKKIQHDFHQGVIPVGDEPSGKSWTGFQSVGNKGGYLLIYRENHPENNYPVETWLTAGTTVKCTPLMGNGQSFTQTVGRNGTVEFKLPGTNNYALYKYQIIK